MGGAGGDGGCVGGGGEGGGSDNMMGDSKICRVHDVWQSVDHAGIVAVPKSSHSMEATSAAQLAAVDEER